MRETDRTCERERKRETARDRETYRMDVGRERESQFVIEGETERGVLPDEESQLVIEGETESNLAIGDWRLEIWNCTGDWRFEIAIGDWRLTIGINGNPRFIPQISRSEMTQNDVELTFGALNKR
ncbi:hypothetical protein LXL04_004838 [Taraxacum kok-saghyz]